jgi:hypothetical protein
LGTEHSESGTAQETVFVHIPESYTSESLHCRMSVDDFDWNVVEIQLESTGIIEKTRISVEVPGSEILALLKSSVANR